MKAEDRPWIKWWWDWFERTEHRSLGFIARHCGAYLAHVAMRSPEEGWLLEGSGKPSSVAALAKALGVEGSRRVAEEKTLKALQELVDAGTMEVREDGAYGFEEKLWSKYFGPAPSTPRVQKWRAEQKGKPRAQETDSTFPRALRNAPGNAHGTPSSRARSEDPDPSDQVKRLRNASPAETGWQPEEAPLGAGEDQSLGPPGGALGELGEPRNTDGSVDVPAIRRQLRVALNLEPCAAGEAPSSSSTTITTRSEDGGALHLAPARAAHRKEYTARLPRRRASRHHAGQRALWPVEEAHREGRVS